MSPLAKAFHFLEGRVRRHDGPLTSELVRSPGRFGLGQIPDRLAPDATTAMVCGFCSTGCSLKVHLRKGEAVSLTPNPNYPVNLGMACPKGWEALAPLAAADRATVPLLRRGVNRDMEEISWETAAETFTKRMKFILAKHGPESVAFLSTGQICTEEMAFLGAFAKFGMGLIHGDGNTRQCMATAVRAYKESFGFDAPPFTYADFEEADVIVLTGSNLCIAHPILWQRILRNQRSPDIVVIDPRKTETAMQATSHLAIHPKSDLVLFYGLARLLIERGLVDHDFIEAHTEGFAGFSSHVAEFSLERTALETGLATDELIRLADLIGSGKRVSFWWTMGVNQGWEATRTAQAIINLALMTGNIGKPGTGANSITGQCNAMGSRLFSNTTNLLGGRDFTDPEHRGKVAEILGISPDHIPDRRSLAYDQIMDGIEAGRIKALWVIGTNPAHSWIGRKDFSAVLAKLDFLVVQDMYHSTETARLADLVLPAAGWGEKEGTLINSERRIGLVKKVARSPGRALSDFNIFRLLAAAWGCGEMFYRWTSPEAVFEIMQDLSAGQPCDITGIRGYDQIDREGGVQWPFPRREASLPPVPERRLFENGQFFRPNRRALFAFEAPCPDPEPPDTFFPLRLLTGRGSSAQWHTQTRTGKSGVLRNLSPGRNHLEIHPLDAAAFGIESGKDVIVTSRRGSITVRVFVTPTVPPGSVFIPMHEESTNRLTLPVVDPHSRQPSYKSCAVKVERA
jgi:anaerobic selenocysteine-containing dehydrogenase